jgi:hypothetical protein
MRTSKTFPLRFWALLSTGLLLFQFNVDAFAGPCKFDRDFDLKLDVSGSEKLTIRAVAGDLDVIGVAGLTEAVISGKLCASKEAWAEEASINTESGKHARIAVNLPDAGGGWSMIGNKYIWLDLRVEVPLDLAIEVQDSSGDIFIRNTASLRVDDSSGDIEIVDARGAVSINDSSGDIEVEQLEGDLTIESDSSGDIEADDINGNVLVEKDSSGDIDVAGVSGDVIVERDSSGDIDASNVGGDFRVLKDGSGGIRSRDVSGEVQVPDKD